MKTRKGKSKMGRPPKPPDQRHSEQVNVRMTKAERARRQAEADRLEISLSALLMRPWRKKTGG